MSNEKRFTTEQESFWAGSFGTNYISRNEGEHVVASNLALFSRALEKVKRPASCIEFGANIGLNLDALKLLYPEQDQFAVEINPDAATILRSKLPEERVFETSILDFPVTEPRKFDLVVIKGVLIHIDPNVLDQVYEKLYEATGRYLMVCEYYNPTPVTISYRGHSERLFKRDFAGEMLERYESLRLLDYGFVYRRDPSFPQDDLTWFLMEVR